MSESYPCREDHCSLEFDVYQARNAHEAAHKDEKPYKKENVLRELYWDEGMSAQEIAEKFDTNRSAIYFNMEKYDIPRREKAEALEYDEYDVQFFISNGGHTYVKEDFKKTRNVAMHRLLAVAKYGFDAVKDMHVHHKNGMPSDNRLSNIELLTAAEHAKRHGDLYMDHVDEDEVKRLYFEEGLMQREIGEKYGLAQTTVSRIVNS